MTADPGIRLHRKQFLVGPEVRTVADDWLSLAIGDGLWLSHGPELRVEGTTDRDGRTWTLLGLASQTVAGRLLSFDDERERPAIWREPRTHEGTGRLDEGLDAAIAIDPHDTVVVTPRVSWRINERPVT